MDYGGRRTDTFSRQNGKGDLYLEVQAHSLKEKKRGLDARHSRFSDGELPFLRYIPVKNLDENSATFICLSRRKRQTCFGGLLLTVKSDE